MSFPLGGREKAVLELTQKLGSEYFGKIGTITINTFLPMRKKFVYSCSVKIHAWGFNKLLESIFCILLVMEAFCLQKVGEMLEEVVVG